MKEFREGEEQVAYALRLADGGTPVSEDAPAAATRCVAAL